MKGVALAMAAMGAILALAACADGGGPSLTPSASPTATATATATPSATPSPAPSPVATALPGIGSYDDPFDFRSFAAQLAEGIVTADIQFFLDNVTFEQVPCDYGFPTPPASCAGQTGTTVPGIVVGVWQSEGFGLDAVGYEEFVREFLTDFDPGASDAYGDAEPRLYAYAIFRPEFQRPSMALETVQAIATRIVSGPPPRFPPPGRSVLLFHTSFDGQRWSITHLTVGLAAFLDPTGPGAIEAGVEGVLQFWQRWEG